MIRVTIPADEQRGFQYEITIILGDAIEDKYEVVAKDFPKDLPRYWHGSGGINQNLEITWISNFGLRKRDGAFAVQLPAGEEYSIEVPAGLGDHFVYFDGENVRELTGEVSEDKFIARLNLGDPPIGSSI